MPKFRCEFLISPDLVLPADSPNVPLLTLHGDLSITIRNTTIDEDGHPTELVASVVGSATSFDRAEDELRAGLAECLDLLAFATHSRFKISGPVRLLEWNEGQRTRKGRIFHTRDARNPPDPELRTELLDTIHLLDAANPPPFARTALKYFRYGLLDEAPEDQFMRFWLALEIIAENVKERERIPITCSGCGSAMTCATCGKEQTRFPMPKQAIEQLIEKVVGAKSAPVVSKRQFTARNGLMHGRSAQSIEAESNTSLAEIVDELGTIVWHAIMSTIPVSPIAPPLHLAHREGHFTNQTLTVSVDLTFDHTGDSLHPSDDKLPSGTLSLQTTFSPVTAGSG
jgi:hypothetical protein